MYFNFDSMVHLFLEKLKTFFSHPFIYLLSLSRKHVRECMTLLLCCVTNSSELTDGSSALVSAVNRFFILEVLLMDLTYNQSLINTNTKFKWFNSSNCDLLYVYCNPDDKAITSQSRNAGFCYSVYSFSWPHYIELVGHFKSSNRNNFLPHILLVWRQWLKERGPN
jgi:hypothetical protein